MSDDPTDLWVGGERPWKRASYHQAVAECPHEGGDVCPECARMTPAEAEAMRRFLAGEETP